jgi:predicted nucleic acid-binding protein
MLIDTDVFIEILRDTPDARNWLASQRPQPFLSGIAALEATFGSQSRTELRIVRTKLTEFTKLWPEPEDIRRAVNDSAQIKLSHGLGSLDAITASIPLRHNLPIVTSTSNIFRLSPV